MSNYQIDVSYEGEFYVVKTPRVTTWAPKPEDVRRAVEIGLKSSDQPVDLVFPPNISNLDMEGLWALVEEHNNSLQP